MNGHKPKVKGDGTTHWYECECGNALNPYETICPKCLDLIDWSSEIKGWGEQE